MRQGHTAGRSHRAQEGPAQPPPPHARAARKVQGNPDSQPCAKQDRLVLTTSSQRKESASVPTHARDPKLLSAAPSSRGVPGIGWEKMSPATPRHPFDITVHQAEAPLALVLSQKSRKGRKPASLSPDSPATLRVLPNGPTSWGGRSLGAPCTGHSPRGPRENLPTSQSTRI